MSKQPKEASKRDPFDFYSTPDWCIFRLLEKVNIPSNSLILEPSAGNGAIIRAINEYSKTNSNFAALKKENVYLAELQEQFEQQLTEVADNVFIGDFLKYDFKKQCKTQKKADFCIGNPPYKIAFEILKHALTQAETVCFLMRINFLSSGVRASWMQKNIPDVYVLPNRPKFKNNRSDSCEYAWCIWGPNATGKLHILNTTPTELRRTK